MYRVIKRMEISGAHRLSLPYESKCRGLHGHNWIITVFCKSETLDENGMVVSGRAPEQLGDAMRQIKANYDRYDRRTISSFAANQFNDQAIMRRLEAMYGES